MLKRITKLLDSWESLMQLEQKAVELNIISFEKSIRYYNNHNQIDIMRLKMRLNFLNSQDKTFEDLEELKFIQGALEILESNN
jgi:hypothetical protein